ncbi:MAG TPA: hypothetical protein VMJ34_00340 [Bryobacteraceae bacterium]|nr:hypothetical protein [Bryobacteraceae bacterium]
MQQKLLKIVGTVVLLLAAGVTANAASTATTPYVLPQLAFGGGWYSALYFANQSDTDAQIAIYFVGSDGTALLVPLVGQDSAVTDILITVPAHGTSLIEAPNKGGLSQGYATFFLPAGVVGYGIFRQSVAGRADQEAVVPFTSSTVTSSTMVFDETSYITAVAIVNPSPNDATISVLALDDDGRTLGTATIPLPAKNKVVSTMKTLTGMSGIVGHRGTITFSVTTGNVAALGLRFNGYAFTSIPLTGNTPSTAPSFNSFNINVLFLPLNAAQEFVNFAITPTNKGIDYSATFSAEGLTMVNGKATTDSHGTTFTFSKLIAASNAWYGPPGSGIYFPVVLDASLTLTVTQTSTDPNTGAATGTVSGQLIVTGVPLTRGATTLSGGVIGTYVQPGPPK